VDIGVRASQRYEALDLRSLRRLWRWWRSPVLPSGRCRWRHNETRADLSNLGASTVGDIAGNPATTKPSVAAVAPPANLTRKTSIASTRRVDSPGSSENRTGDAFLDGTVESILERELEFSEHVRVVQRDRWEDALRLRGIALDSPRTAAVARQVARTDNGIAALVEGAIEKAPRAYTISLNVVDVMSGQSVDTLVEHVTDRSDVETVDLGDEVWRAVEARFDLAPVVFPSPSDVRASARSRAARPA
jgi:hypothetical protein